MEPRDIRACFTVRTSVRENCYSLAALHREGITEESRIQRQRRCDGLLKIIRNYKPIFHSIPHVFFVPFHFMFAEQDSQA
jgi:hypothetical protein